MTEYAHFVCRDIGYGVEEGDVVLPALDDGESDLWGKRSYATPDGDVVYLFDDEVQSMTDDEES